MKGLLSIVLVIFLVSCGGGDDAPMEPAAPITTIDPTTSILNILNILDFEAEISVAIQSDDNSSIGDKGVVWSINTNPTVDDNLVSAGSGTSDFSTIITGLVSNTQYNVRSFINVEGNTIYSGSTSFFTTNSCANNVFEGNVRLETQADVNAFGVMGFCSINGGLQIGTIIVDDDRITDISLLSTIKEAAALNIFNTLLLDLDDLSNFVKTDFVTVAYNENLENLDGLSNVNTDVKEIIIGDNPILKNLDGLSSITKVYGGNTKIIISNNNLLSNISGLQGIVAIDFGSISIFNNDSLTDLDGIHNIADLSETSIAIRENDNLIDLSALRNINDSIYQINIENNESLFDLDGLQFIRYAQNIYINQNNSLSNITGLTNLTSVSHIVIGRNNSLLKLDGLENITSDINTFEVTYNDLLVDFCSLVQPLQNINIQNHIVSGNAYNPTQQDIIDGNCSQ